MSEHSKINITPQEAQDRAHAVIEFGIATQSILHEPDFRENEAGVISKASAAAGKGVFDRETKLEYEDLALHPDDVGPSGHRRTKAYVRVPGRIDNQYRTTLEAGAQQTAYDRLVGTTSDERNSSASVIRQGYGEHSFSEVNSMRAGALITSLAAKRIAREAFETTDKRMAAIAAAKEVYAQRIAVKDETPDAETVKVRTNITN